jgi:cell division protein FtsW
MRRSRSDLDDRADRGEVEWMERVSAPEAGRTGRGSRAGDLQVRPPTVHPSGLDPRGGPRRELHDPDWVIVVTVTALAAVGILMVYSASAIDAYKASRNTFEMVVPQIGAGALGLMTMIVLAWVDYRWMRKASVIMVIVALALLVIVLTPVGVAHNGSSRWIKIGPFFEVHPAEVAKLALAVYLSHWLATRGAGIQRFLTGTVPYWIIVIPFVMLIWREPDLGTMSIIVLIALTLYFVAGARLWHLALALAGGAAGGAALILTVGSYSMQRIQIFLNPWADPEGAGYHTIKGLQALAAGGLFGTGLGNDKVIVPNDFNDFIFSVIAQELGFVGGIVVIALFAAFAWAGVRTSMRAPDTFGALLAAAITAWISFQALVNIGVVLALLPVTGITLPFVSQGGSSLVVSFAAVGILLSISRETAEQGWVNASADRGRGYGRTYIPGPRGGSIAADSTGRP